MCLLVLKVSSKSVSELQCPYRLTANREVAGHECCQQVDTSTRTARDIRALGYITMELMQKYPQEDGRIGLENLDRWPSNSKAVDFLSMTTSVTSVKELSKVRSIRVFIFSLRYNLTSQARPA
jgi:hypothetical protein